MITLRHGLCIPSLTLLLFASTTIKASTTCRSLYNLDKNTTCYRIVAAYRWEYVTIVFSVYDHPNVCITVSSSCCQSINNPCVVGSIYYGRSLDVGLTSAITTPWCPRRLQNIYTPNLLVALNTRKFATYDQCVIQLTSSNTSTGICPTDTLNRCNNKEESSVVTKKKFHGEYSIVIAVGIVGIGVFCYVSCMIKRKRLCQKKRNTGNRNSRPTENSSSQSNAPVAMESSTCACTTSLINDPTRYSRENHLNALPRYQFASTNFQLDVSMLHDSGLVPYSRDQTLARLSDWQSGLTLVDDSSTNVPNGRNIEQPPPYSRNKNEREGNVSPPYQNESNIEQSGQSNSSRSVINNQPLNDLPPPYSSIAFINSHSMDSYQITSNNCVGCFDGSNPSNDVLYPQAFNEPPPPYSEH